MGEMENEIRRREEEEKLRQHYSTKVREVTARGPTDKLSNNEQTKTERDDEEEERARLEEQERESEDLRKTELRIKELQSSIMSLDWQLERTEIAKMKKKTEK